MLLSATFFTACAASVDADAPPAKADVASDVTYETRPGGDFIVLAGLDESTYSPVNTVYGDRSDLRMGPKPEDHPIIWAKCHGETQARSVFTAMGHCYETYDAKEAVLILKNALNWTAKKTDPEGQGCSN